MPTNTTLRYGSNPHQKRASFTAPEGAIDVLNGAPSYINLLDVLTGWQMTRDLALVSGGVAAVSMKHCIAVGLAVPGRLDELTKALLGVNSVGPTASAYLRARSSDWSASYGDMAVIFGEVDDELAHLMARLVSDGIAATGFTRRALDVLTRKRQGQYLIMKLDEGYVPPDQETRSLFGFQLTQERNSYLPSVGDFEVITGPPEVADAAGADLCLSVVAMKYSVSNNIVIASGGRTLAVAAGQQSRILSTRLACSKYEHYQRMQHPDVVATVQTMKGKLTDRVAEASRAAGRLRSINMRSRMPVVMGSDGFIPFSDNIETASEYGINIVLEPGGALRSEEIEATAEYHELTLVRTKRRFFYH